MRRGIALTTLILATLAIAAPGMAGAGGRGGCPDGFGEQSHPEVSIADNCFISTIARIGIGDTVTWTNDDAWPHDIFSPVFTGTGPFSDTYSYRFDEPGIYPYLCTIHPGMIGAVVVGEGPVHAALVSPIDVVEGVANSSPQARWVNFALLAAGLATGAALTRNRHRPAVVSAKP